jgi:putative ATPase
VSSARGGPGLFGAEPERGEDAVDAVRPIAADAPLAERMRPRAAEEFHGQAHLVGQGRILAQALAGELRQSLILWGPPGSGKTTLALLVARANRMRFVPFSAVLAGIKEIKAVMAEAARERARRGQRTLLFIDEIHRFNKAQQDAFLPHVERGDILLIGATTENPSFEVVSPLLSRARTLVLEPLASADLVRILEHALADRERGLAGRVAVAAGVLERIAASADGDARRALTLLETAASLLPEGATIDERILVEALQRKSLHYDKAGEEHYNLISALHKSVRNGDADASVYWLTRMLEAGEDRRFLARRLIRMALEDVGSAGPQALVVTMAASQAWDRLGTPEGELALVEAAVYLARAPKSNALYVAYGRAREDVQSSANEPVPLHLRNAVTGLMKEVGYGAGYRYVHDDPAAKDEMGCLPPGLEGRRYFDDA